MFEELNQIDQRIAIDINKLMQQYGTCEVLNIANGINNGDISVPEYDKDEPFTQEEISAKSAYEDKNKFGANEARHGLTGK